MAHSNKKANGGQGAPAGGPPPPPFPSLDGSAAQPRAPLERPRRGGFTRHEKDILFKAYVAGEQVEAVAVRIDRPVDTVKRYFDTLAAKGVASGGEAPPEKSQRQLLLEGLHGSPQWKAIRDKFENNEVKLYEDHYALLLEQFGSDVVITERLQVDKYLTGLILADRNLIDQKRVRGVQADLRAERTELMVQHAGRPVGQDAARVVQLEQFEENCRNELAGLVKEYRDLDANNGRALEGLRGTRLQRLARLEERATSILDVVKELMREDKREDAGRQAALFRQAALKKAVELGREVQFADGTMSRPLLNVDTVGGREGG